MPYKDLNDLPESVRDSPHVGSGADAEIKPDCVSRIRDDVERLDTRAPASTHSMSQRPFSRPPRRAAKQAGESKRGQHNQSIDPARDTSAAVSQSPISA